MLPIHHIENFLIFTPLHLQDIILELRISFFLLRQMRLRWSAGEAEATFMKGAEGSSARGYAKSISTSNMSAWRLSTGRFCLIRINF